MNWQMARVLFLQKRYLARYPSHCPREQGAILFAAGARGLHFSTIQHWWFA